MNLLYFLASVCLLPFLVNVSFKLPFHFDNDSFSCSKSAVSVAAVVSWKLHEEINSIKLQVIIHLFTLIIYAVY